MWEIVTWSSQLTWGVGNQVDCSWHQFMWEVVTGSSWLLWAVGDQLDSAWSKFITFGHWNKVVMQLPVRCDLSDKCPQASSFVWVQHTSSSTKTQSNSQKRQTQIGTRCHIYTPLEKMCKGNVSITDPTCSRPVCIPHSFCYQSQCRRNWTLIEGANSYKRLETGQKLRSWNNHGWEKYPKVSFNLALELKKIVQLNWSEERAVEIRAW